MGNIGSVLRKVGRRLVVLVFVTAGLFWAGLTSAWAGPTPAPTQAPSGPGLNTNGLENFLRNNIVNILILFVAAGMLLLANKGEFRQAMTRMFIVIAALFVLGLAISGKATDLAAWAVGLVTG